MHALPKITNPLRPRGRQTFIAADPLPDEALSELSRSLQHGARRARDRYPRPPAGGDLERKIRRCGESRK